MSKLICPKCGEANNDINSYCSKCKTIFEKEKTANDKQKDSENISWNKAMLFPNKNYIESLVQNNINVNFIRNPKIFLIVFLIFRLVYINYDFYISNKNNLESGLFIIVTLAFTMPILYLLIKDYRLAYILLILLIVPANALPITVLLFSLIALIAITGIRIQSARVRLKISKKPKIIKDSIIAISIFIILFFCLPFLYSILFGYYE